eukprot:Lithocolla_globosa_v1_NODE_4807_length_1361_cov_3.684533.p1 type:complete len:420 gc:universal NODE_4807_length_1361_cov_3.684533:101-1360(+)
MAESSTSGGTSDLLPKERSKATFSVPLMSAAFYGGEENVKRRRFIIGPIQDQQLTHTKYDFSREEAMKRSVDSFISIHKEFTTRGFRPQPNDLTYMSGAAQQTGPLMPCFLLFLPTLVGQASQEQIKLWYPKALAFEIVGAYCQTELSHGSNVRGLQTTATFDKVSGDFILNTPNLGSMKWWNSGCGAVANFGAVFAKCIIEGKNYGNHCFMVQFRDENHQPLPGIELGDVGYKLGDNAIDTGFIRFHNVRVPREHLMSKRQHVTREGKYIKHASAKVEGSAFASYMTMVKARAGTIDFSSARLSIAATIAARYSCVRLQGFTSSKNVSERAIIDYQVQQFRILRQISNVYAFRFTSVYMTRKMMVMSEQVARGEPISDLPEIHAASSGLKSVSTRMTADGIEDLRRSCGGHGYLLNSG